MLLLAACSGPEAAAPSGTDGVGTTGLESETSFSVTGRDESSSARASSETGADSRSGGTFDPDSSTGGDPPAPYEPVRYPAGRVHSPVTAFVADRWRSVAGTSNEPREDVFLKAGASSTVSHHALFCFDGGAVELGVHGHLEGARAYFLGGDAAGTSPFARASMSAESGRSAAWALTGSPSPLAQEWGALNPRVALVHFGTNDMNLGATHGSAMVPFHEAMTALVEDLVGRGSLPVLLGITRRGDDPTANLWVESYNAVIRGIAQSRQVPFIDLYEAIDPLPEHGLGSDGIHLLASPEGACTLSEEGLQWGFNMRNLVALEALDRTMAVLVDDAAALDDAAPGFEGDGTLEDPVRIDALPFAHAADTTRAGLEDIDAYPSCDDADESGPEVRYRLELSEPTPLRMLVLDHPEVDVDVHLLEAGGDGDGCLARADRRIEGSLPAGTWDIVVDTWSSDGAPYAGEYLLVVVRCQPGDEACAGALS